MAFKTPSYLTKNSLGIYQFQARLPKRVLAKAPNLPPFFRKSLSTREPRTASSLARRWAVALENILDNENTSNLEDALTLLRISPVDQPHLKANSTQSTEQRPRTSLNTAPAACNSIGIRLSEALEDYIGEKRRSWNPKAINGNERSIRLKIGTFIEIVGDIYCQQLTTKVIVEYKVIILKLPANRSKIKQYRQLSIKKLMEIEVPEHHRLGTETLMGHFNKISAFLDWCGNNGIAPQNLKSPLRNTLKNPVSVNLQRDSFNSSDLQKLFHSDQYQMGTHSSPSRFFVPLLALFTGARQNELCQLYTSDVYQDTESGIWVIDINANSADKRLKRASHARLIPIHPAIKKLGFISYAERNKNLRLFPELKFKRDGYAQSFSRWFNDTYRNKQNCDVGNEPGENKNFHSFRHTFITKLVNEIGVPQHKVAHIVGHRPSDNSETIQRYTKTTELQDREKIICMVQYSEIDLNDITSWEAPPNH